LSAFDRNGKLLWRKRQHGYSGKPDELLGVEDLTVTTGGEIAVLSNVQKAVKYFSLDGKYLRTRKLAAATGKEPNYPTGIARDRDGGILIRDFNGKPPLIRISRDGALISAGLPRHRDQRVFDVSHGAQVSSMGDVWVCDGESLARLDSNWTVAEIVGKAPNEQTLGEIVAVSVDEAGSLYALDQRTGAVHMFDEKGKALRIFTPAKTDFNSKLMMARVISLPKGGVAIENYESPYVQFDEKGTRLGTFGLLKSSLEQGFWPEKTAAGWPHIMRASCCLTPHGK
jgi:hypothetical protein